MESEPYDSRCCDRTQSPLVNMQDVQRILHNDMPMDGYQQNDKISSYSIHAHQEPLCNDLVPQQGRGYYVRSDTVASSHHRVTLDHRNGTLKTSMGESALLDSQSTRSSSDSGKDQPMGIFQGHSFSTSKALSNNSRSLQGRVNSTSKSATIISQDLASTLALEIADRLGFSSDTESQYKTKEDVKRAIQDSFKNLLSSNQPTGNFTQDSPAGDGADIEKLYKCEFCSKKKKTQCDLT